MMTAKKILGLFLNFLNLITQQKLKLIFRSIFSYDFFRTFVSLLLLQICILHSDLYCANQKNLSTSAYISWFANGMKISLKNFFGTRDNKIHCSFVGVQFRTRNIILFTAVNYQPTGMKQNWYSFLQTLYQSHKHKYSLQRHKLPSGKILFWLLD